MLAPPKNMRSEFETLADSALRNSGMDSVGLYRFTADRKFDCGVIRGMPDTFVRRYEISGIPVDPVLADLLETGLPSSTETLLGDRWEKSILFKRVSGEFGLTGFAALPLYDASRLSGVLYLGALTQATKAKLSFRGIAELSIQASALSTALIRLPKQHHALTSRQNEVARLASAGLSNREIAEELHTGEAAVRKHLKALNRIFGTTSRGAMAARWRRDLEQA